MHLTLENCWYSSGATSDDEHSIYQIASSTITTTSCVQRWLFRTQTIFYQYPNFHLPYYFGIACWSYVVAGIVMLYTAPPAWFVHLQHQQQQEDEESHRKRWRYSFPYYTFIILLIFVQSPLSFLADYIYMDQDSIFHVIDRMIAIPLMTLELWKVVCLWRWCWRRRRLCDYSSHTVATVSGTHRTNNDYYYYHPTVVVILYTLGTITAIACFLQSQQSQSEQDINGFILWHNRWHLYPLYASIITLYDHFIHLQQLPVGKVVFPVVQKQQDDTMNDVPSALLSPLQMMQLSTVSSSSSLSSAANTKDKDL